MKKRRTKAQKAKAKRRNALVTQQTQNIPQSEQRKVASPTSPGVKPKEMVTIEIDRDVALIRRDLVKTGLLSLLIIGIEWSIYLWWK